FNKIVNLPILVIEDLGTENPKFNDYGARNLIVDILMLRYIRFQKGLCITHITSNFPRPILEDIYKENPRFVDRIIEMFNFEVLSPEPSKRQNPPPMVDDKEFLRLLEKKEFEQRISYYEYFAANINNPETTEFYDRGLMWEFLVKFRFISPKLLEDDRIK